MTAPGWYPNPTDPPGHLRWFDGTAWTDQVQAPTPPTQSPMAAPPPAGMPPVVLPPTAPAPAYPAPTPRSGSRRKSRRRWPWIVVGVIVVIVIIAAVAGGSKKKTNSPPAAVTTTTTTTTSHAASTTPSPGVSKGIGSADATGDVTLGPLGYDSSLDDPDEVITITNHSSKRSDYDVTVALESADGKTQLDSEDAYVQNLEPGQSSNQTVDFSSLDGHAPAGAKIVLQEVQRIASS